MTHHEFCVWLHGFTELTETKQPTEAQWKMIVEHLDLMFDKVTPKLGITLKPPTVTFPTPPPFDKPAWLTQKDGAPWPPGTITC